MTFDPSELVRRVPHETPNAQCGPDNEDRHGRSHLADQAHAGGGEYRATGPAAGSKRTSPVHPGVGGSAGRPVVIGHRGQRGGR